MRSAAPRIDVPAPILTSFVGPDGKRYVEKAAADAALAAHRAALTEVASRGLVDGLKALAKRRYPDPARRVAFMERYWRMWCRIDPRDADAERVFTLTYDEHCLVTVTMRLPMLIFERTHRLDPEPDDDLDTAEILTLARDADASLRRGDVALAFYTWLLADGLHRLSNARHGVSEPDAPLIADAYRIRDARARGRRTLAAERAARRAYWLAEIWKAYAVLPAEPRPGRKWTVRQQAEQVRKRLPETMRYRVPSLTFIRTVLSRPRSAVRLPLSGTLAPPVPPA
jgi:hypothetical protein